MNRIEFFSVVKITRSAVQVEQLEDSFELSISVNHEGEEPQKVALVSKIKSLNTVEMLLRENGIFEFTVKIKKEAIPKVPRKKSE